MAEELANLIRLILIRAAAEFFKRFGFWGGLALTLGFVVALWLIGWAVTRMVRGLRVLVDRMTKVVPPGQAVPAFFGVSYMDLATNSRVCQVIPINLFLGLAQAARLRLKRGLGVKVGRKHA